MSTDSQEFEGFGTSSNRIRKDSQNSEEEENEASMNCGIVDMNCEFFSSFNFRVPHFQLKSS